MASTYVMSGALPINVIYSTSYNVRYSVAEKIDTPRRSCELSGSTSSYAWPVPVLCSECVEPPVPCKNDWSQRNFFFFAEDYDNVYDLLSSRPRTSPTQMKYGKVGSGKRHTGRLSEVTRSIFHRRQGSNGDKTLADLNIDSSYQQQRSATATPTTEERRDIRFHSCPSPGAPCNCVLEKYIEFSSGDRTLVLPDSISPAVTETEELARQQYVACLKRGVAPREERGGLSGEETRERRRQARKIKQTLEERMIEERFQTHMERRRREEAENRATEFRELVLEPYEFGRRDQSTKLQPVNPFSPEISPRDKYFLITSISPGLPDCLKYQQHEYQTIPREIPSKSAIEQFRPASISSNHNPTRSTQIKPTPENHNPISPWVNIPIGPVAAEICDLSMRCIDCRLAESCLGTGLVKI